MIDWTISLGNVLTLVGFVGGGVGFVYAVRRDVSILTTKIAPLEVAANRIVDKLEVILDRQSRHDERLKVVERDIERGYLNGHRSQPGPR